MQYKTIQTESNHSKRSYFITRQQIKQQRHTDCSTFFKVPLNQYMDLTRPSESPYSPVTRTLGTLQLQTTEIPYKFSENSLTIEKQLNLDRSFGDSNIIQRGKSLAIELPSIMKSKVVQGNPENRRRIEKHLHQRDPLHKLQEQNFDAKNLQKLKRYQRLWRNKERNRGGFSILNKSNEKSNDLLRKHNKTFAEKKSSVHLDQQLRSQNKEVKDLTKGIHAPHISGLKGKGGNIKLFLESVFMVEQVYKSQKRNYDGKVQKPFN